MVYTPKSRRKISSQYHEKPVTGQTGIPGREREGGKLFIYYYSFSPCSYQIPISKCFCNVLPHASSPLPLIFFFPVYSAKSVSRRPIISFRLRSWTDLPPFSNNAVTSQFHWILNDAVLSSTDSSPPVTASSPRGFPIERGVDLLFFLSLFFFLRSSENLELFSFLFLFFYLLFFFFLLRFSKAASS